MMIMTYIVTNNKVFLVKFYKSFSIIERHSHLIRLVAIQSIHSRLIIIPHIHFSSHRTSCDRDRDRRLLSRDNFVVILYTVYSSTKMRLLY